MVALKQTSLDPQKPVTFKKQERRGGIETLGEIAFPAEDAGKQERRGGIETALDRAKVFQHVTEAGTPWWH